MLYSIKPTKTSVLIEIRKKHNAIKCENEDDFNNDDYKF